MKFKLILVFFLLVDLFGCTTSQEIKLDLESGDKIRIINAAHWIQKNNISDTSVVVSLLKHILDTRIVTSFKYRGECPYIQRIYALERITGLKSPYEVSDMKDALIVDFYLTWALEKKIINSKDEVDVVPPYIYEILDSQQFFMNIKNYDKVSWLAKYSWKRLPPEDRLHN